MKSSSQTCHVGSHGQPTEAAPSRSRVRPEARFSCLGQDKKGEARETKTEKQRCKAKKERRTTEPEFRSKQENGSEDCGLWPGNQEGGSSAEEEWAVRVAPLGKGDPSSPKAPLDK